MFVILEPFCKSIHCQSWLFSYRSTALESNLGMSVLYKIGCYYHLLQDSAKAYAVLMTYLNLILFDHGDHGNHATPGHVIDTVGSSSRQLLSPLLADSLVEIYAEHRPEQLTNFLLHSWVKNYSPGIIYFLGLVDHGLLASMVLLDGDLVQLGRYTLCIN